MNSENERVTIVLPKDYREKAKESWSLSGSMFNYSQYIREAMAKDFRDQDDRLS